MLFLLLRPNIPPNMEYSSYQRCWVEQGSMFRVTRANTIDHYYTLGGGIRGFAVGICLVLAAEGGLFGGWFPHPCYSVKDLE